MFKLPWGLRVCTAAGWVLAPAIDNASKSHKVVHLGIEFPPNFQPLNQYRNFLKSADERTK
jgi:hypothetical protein